MSDEPFRLYCHESEFCDDRAALARRRDASAIEYVCASAQGLETQDGEGDVGTTLALALLWEEHAETREMVAPLQPGHYHPRIWRNGVPPNSPDDDSWTDPELNKHLPLVLPATEFEALRAHTAALHRIQGLVGEVFDVVTPCDANAGAFGAAIRQVLVLCAIEVESMLTQGFAANRDPADGRGKTSFNDWKQLFPYMRLNEWAARLPAFPN